MCVGQWGKCLRHEPSSMVAFSYKNLCQFSTNHTTRLPLEGNCFYHIVCSALAISFRVSAMSGAHGALLSLRKGP